MNTEIEIMINLQKIWTNILEAEEKIDRAEKSIDYWDKRVKTAQNDLRSNDELIKNLKGQMKSLELTLSEADNRIKKLDGLQNQLKNEKEIGALSAELANFKSDKGSIEESIFKIMENLDAAESKMNEIRREVDELETQSKKDIISLKEIIKNQEIVISENKKKFEDKLPSLSSLYRAKFQKLLTSKGGRAIAEINDNICTGCNFTIPVALAQDSSRDDKVVNCTNCGRFIYK